MENEGHSCRIRIPPALGTSRNNGTPARNNAPDRQHFVIPWSAATRQSIQPFRRKGAWAKEARQANARDNDKGITQMSADGLPRAFGPRNDDEVGGASCSPVGWTY
ncbi:MAG: hypothetical protein LBO00_02860 [Zoogloeaceae bacterium]|nr:hypothetical protein [Zoogloeaceae bacterium]